MAALVYICIISTTDRFVVSLDVTKTEGARENMMLVSSVDQDTCQGTSGDV